ncbi:glutathione S-transferase family protein [Algibacillus agarilyticus]|uniref:glutathione S-transferase family protein n=1 Tax=Algibacillus agarilyticus TaxID=2234133 RepID=UPI000DD002E0|nr:glutathione S-transferase [Algibacillus agarilyticus]
MSTIKLYSFPVSGYSHRVRVFTALLGLDIKLINVDLRNAEQKTPAFLAKNPAGQVPVIEDDEVTLADSNAILLYLAQKYDASRQWYPESIIQQAHIQRFLTFAAHKVANGPATARLIKLFGAPLDYELALNVSKDALTQLEAHLKDRNWLVGEQATIADIANYTYVAHAPEGEVDLSPYPHVIAWLQRFEQLPGFVPMQKMQA